MRPRATWSRVPISVERFIAFMDAHRGVSNAVTARAIGRGLGCLDPDPGRAVREAAYEACLRGAPIGSLPSTADGEKPGGYFWIADEGELAACVRNYRARIAGIEEKIQVLVDAFRMGPRQRRLFSVTTVAEAEAAAPPQFTATVSPRRARASGRDRR